MKVIVDGFGGDNAPLAVLKGASMAIKEYGVNIIMTGEELVLKQVALENNIDVSKIIFSNTTSVVPLDAPVETLMSDYEDSSLVQGFELLSKEVGDAIVTAGSTAAVVMCGSLIVKRIKGIKRPALAPIMPSQTGPFIMLDAGANSECRAEMLCQFATMGSIYMEKIMGIQEPRVRLANIGEEETKGLDLQIRTFQLLLQDPTINFLGNIEGREIPLGGADVVVTDGFTGNMILKTMEGMGVFFANSLNTMFKGLTGKLSAMFVFPKINALKKKMDYKEHGGAPLLGTQKTVIKAHGSSDAVAIKNAIRQAKEFHEKEIINEISLALIKKKQAQEEASKKMATVPVEPSKTKNPNSIDLVEENKETPEGQEVTETTEAETPTAPAEVPVVDKTTEATPAPDTETPTEPATETPTEPVAETTPAPEQEEQPKTPRRQSRRAAKK